MHTDSNPSGSVKVVSRRMGLFRNHFQRQGRPFEEGSFEKCSFSETLESREFGERTPQIVENKGETDNLQEILEKLERFLKFLQ